MTTLTEIQPSLWRRLSTALYTRPGVALLLSYPYFGCSSSTSAHCWHCCCNPSSTSNNFTGQMVRELSLDSYRDLVPPPIWALCSAPPAWPFCHHCRRPAFPPRLLRCPLRLPARQSHSLSGNFAAAVVSTIIHVYSWKLILARKGY
ncbi:MAG: hypothetical protein H6668_12340 [Ardenticatenaceae bacterium]|nr:hypothetical protein [Ardenticatenaceae bacterium]